MKAVVRKRFGDKYTGEVYEAGSVLELTPERYAEIRATDTGLIVAVVEDPEKEEQTAEQPGTADPENEGQTAEQPGTADPESEEKAEEQQEAAGQKPKRTKKQAKQGE